MGNLMEAFLAIMGLVSGIYALALILGQLGPMATQHESASPERSQAIRTSRERLAA